MNKLNPIYIILLFVTTVLVSFFLLFGQKSDYKEKLEQLALISKNSKEYTQYKANWDNKT